MISIFGLKKQFGLNNVLSNINIIIPNNTILGITGKNGAGKSTLLNILGGLLKPDDGVVLINNNEKLIHSFSQSLQIGCVFEKPLYIEKLTGFEYLYFIGEMYNMPEASINQRVIELLNFFDLNQHKSKLVESYSKGMKSKLSLATALFHSPKYLFLDEPFDGCDIKSINNIVEMFICLKKNGSTILISSHDMINLTKMCDSISVIENGIITKI